MMVYPEDERGNVRFTFLQCTECERVFDMLDEEDAEEANYGHDCEEV